MLTKGAAAIAAAVAVIGVATGHMLAQSPAQAQRNLAEQKQLDIDEVANLCNFQQRQAEKAGTVLDMDGNPVTIKSDSAALEAAQMIVYDAPIDVVQKKFDKWVPIESRSGGIAAVASFYTCVYEIRLLQLEKRSTSESSRAGAGGGAASGTSGGSAVTTGSGATVTRPPATGCEASAENYADPKTYKDATKTMFLQELRTSCTAQRSAHLAAWGGLPTDTELDGDEYLERLITLDAAGVAGERTGVGNGTDPTAVFQRCLLDKRDEQLARATPPDPNCPPASSTSTPTPQPTPAQCEPAGNPGEDLHPPPEQGEPAYQNWIDLHGDRYDASCKPKRIAFYLEADAVCVAVADPGDFYAAVNRRTKLEAQGELANLIARATFPPSDWTDHDRAQNEWERCLYDVHIKHIPGN